MQITSAKQCFRASIRIILLAVFLSGLGLRGSFVYASPATRTYDWTYLTHGTTNSYSTGSKVRTDSHGNVYVLGVLSGDVTFDGVGGHDSGHAPNPKTTIYLTKRTAGGAYRWTKTMTVDTGGSVDAGGLAIDGADNMYLTANFTGTANFNTFDNVTVSTGPDVYDSVLMKLSPDGSHVWTRRLTAQAASSVFASSLALDSHGHIDVGGSFANEVQFNQNSDTITQGCNFEFCSSGFIAQFSTAGDFGWVQNTTGTADDGTSWYISAAATLSDGSIVVIGNGYNYDTNHSTDYMATYSVTGSFISPRNFGGDARVQSSAIAIDANDNIFLAGSFSGGTILFDGVGGSHSHASQGSNSNAFLIKLNSDGTLAWSKTLDNSNGSSGINWLKLDNANNIYAGGYATGTVGFDGVGGSDSQTVTPSQDDVGSFFMSYDASGVYGFTQTFGGATGSFVSSYDGTVFGNKLYMTGPLQGAVLFDGVGGSDTQASGSGVNDGESFVSSWFLGPRVAEDDTLAENNGFAPSVSVSSTNASTHQTIVSAAPDMDQATDTPVAPEAIGNTPESSSGQADGVTTSANHKRLVYAGITGAAIGGVVIYALLRTLFWRTK